MKVFIDGTLRGAVTRLIPFWKKMGVKIVDKLKFGDVQLAIVRISQRGLPKVPICLRLDGVYYDKDKSIDFERRNSSIARSHKIADAVIYQSNMAKAMAEKYLGKRNGKYDKIIYNGVEDGWNNPIKHKNVNIMCTNKWRRIKRLPEIISIFNEFRNYYPEAKLHVIGPFRKGAYEIKNTNVIYYGQQNHSEMRKIYRKGDFFLHLCKKDSCPSTVVEAIASGMPVVTTNSCGGATEMCNMTGGCVVVDGEEENLEPDYIYGEEYNYLAKDIRNDIVLEMVKIIKEKRRVELPVELTARFVAAQYKRVFKAVKR